jgi:6-phosphogluconate dehydrogenase
MAASNQADLRAVTAAAAASGIPTPGLASCLAYFDAYRSAWLPANLVQAQRDYFGAHQYRRLDREGLFHTQWE